MATAIQWHMVMGTIRTRMAMDIIHTPMPILTTIPTIIRIIIPIITISFFWMSRTASNNARGGRGAGVTAEEGDITGVELNV
jgi:hypothetical protein